jgi:uncharacterized membrane protein YiaA
MKGLFAFLIVVLASLLPTVAFAAPSLLARASRGQISKQDLKNTLAQSPLFLTSTTSTTTNNSGDDGGINGAGEKQSKKSPLFSFARLRQVSNFASFLCVLDCTLLPIITIALPLLGVLNLGAAQLEFFHHLGHQLALFFVLPVGGLTSIVNYVSHKKAWITSLAAVGLCMVGLANSHIDHVPFLGHLHVLHKIQHGALHRVVNIMGCALLLGSNYLSQKQPGCAHGHAAHGPDCGGGDHKH